MPVIQRSGAIAAGQTLQNAVSGSQYEIASRRCVISIGITASAGGLLANVSSGGDIVAEQFPVDATAAWPVIPDQFVFNDVMEALDRLTIPIANPTAGPINYFLIVQIQYL